MMKKVNYYKSYDEDFVESKNQKYQLKDDYKWIHTNIFYKIWSNFLYFIGYLVSFFYCKFGLHVKIENRKILRKYRKQGYFLYGNHTLPVGDAIIPAHICRPKRTYVVASPANLKVKAIGGLLPILGILPIPDKPQKMKDFLKAINTRIGEKKCVVIYPEAHVWPYCTMIRPFSDTSFKFPIENNVASFCTTTTFYKRRIGRKPGVKVYVDGPFLPDENISKKEKQAKLAEEVYNKMLERSKLSTYEYIEYKEVEK